MSRNYLQGSKRSVDIYCASYKFISIGHKRSIEKQFKEEKSCFDSDKTFWPLFPRIIECAKHQETTCDSPHGVLTNTVQVVRSFLEDLRGC